MVRHSTQNNSGAVFTHYERSLLNYGNRKRKLVEENQKYPDDCNLCLSSAREPTSCSYGHIFCRECMIENLISQKEEINRLKKEYESQRINSMKRLEHEESRVKLQNIHVFERAQKGSRDQTDPKRVKLQEETISNSQSSFWLPDQTPSAPALQHSEFKLKPLCPMSTENNIHQISLKSVIRVQFTTEEIGGIKKHVCPACHKAMAKTVKAVLTIPCGHVLCFHCTKRFVFESKICFVCGENIQGSHDKLVIINARQLPESDA